MLNNNLNYVFLVIGFNFVIVIKNTFECNVNLKVIIIIIIF